MVFVHLFKWQNSDYEHCSWQNQLSELINRARRCCLYCSLYKSFFPHSRLVDRPSRLRTRWISLGKSISCVSTDTAVAFYTRGRLNLLAVSTDHQRSFTSSIFHVLSFCDNEAEHVVAILLAGFESSIYKSFSTDSCHGSVDRPLPTSDVVDLTGQHDRERDVPASVGA